MKRKCYEWGSILLAMAAFVCAGIWGLSRWTTAVDQEFQFDFPSYIRVEKGTVGWSNLSFLEDIYQDWAGGPEKVELLLPGLEYRRVKLIEAYGDDRDHYVVRLSLLIPAVAAALLAALSFWRLRKLVATSAVQEKKGPT